MQGINRIRRKKIHYDAQFFEKNGNDDKNAKVTEKVTEGVTEKKILDILQQKPYTTYQELAEQLNVSRKTVSLKIKHLKEKGIIVRAGSDTKGVWQIVKDK